MPLFHLFADGAVERKREEGGHSSAPCAHLALLLILTMLQCVWFVPGTAIHAESPFNQLKAALNHGSHVVVKRRHSAFPSFTLTSDNLRFLLASPSELADFIQAGFVNANGTRISEGRAQSLAVHVCTLLRTCAVAWVCNAHG